MLEYIDPDNEETQAIVLTPTRELCIQVTQALRAYAEHLEGSTSSRSSAAPPIRDQQSRLRAGAQIVVATVGRMMDLISRESLVLTAARYVVLDEADEMLDLGFIEDVEKILRMCPSGRQTLLFSATMPAPVARLAEQLHVRPGDDPGHAEEAHGRLGRAGLRDGRAAQEAGAPRRGAEGGGARAGDHLRAHQDRRSAARRGPAPTRACG